MLLLLQDVFKHLFTPITFNKKEINNKKLTSTFVAVVPVCVFDNNLTAAAFAVSLNFKTLNIFKNMLFHAVTFFF
jgi:hypothetical protein